MPVNYFDDATEAAMLRLQREAVGRPAAEVMSEFAAQVSTLPIPRWHQRGRALFGNWLNSLSCAAADRVPAVAVS